MLSRTDLVSRHPEPVGTSTRGQATPKYCGAQQRSERESYVLRWLGMAIAIVVLVALLVLIRYLIHR